MSDVSIKVLLIEDSPGDAELVRAYLGRQQDVRIEVEHAERLAAGLDRLANAHVDVVLLDLSLPDSTGLETLRRVLDYCPQVPVVVLTGGEEMETALRAVREGAADYLFKGRVEGPLLIRSIRYAIERAERRRVKTGLREAETRYRTLFQQSPDGIILLDPQTCLPVEFNDAACSHLGYSRGEFARLRISDYEAVEREHKIRAHLEAVLRTGQDEFETRHRTKMGDVRDVMAKVRTITLSNRVLVYCTFRDITDQKQAQRALLASERRFRSLVETTSDWIWETDRNGLYSYSSPKVKDLLGYEPEEVVGRTPFDFMPQSEARRVAGLLSDVTKRCAPIVRLENENLHKNGRSVILETSGVPFFDENGDLLGYRGIDRDITAIKQAEESLREGDRRYRQLLAAVTSYTYSVDVDNGVSISTMHGEGCVSVTGYRPEDYQSDPGLWIAMVHPEDRKPVQEHVGKVLACEEVWPIEHRIVHRDGSIRWVRNTMIPHCEDNTLVRYDGLIEDITYQKRVETTLRDREMQLLAAQKIQQRLLPEAAPAISGFDIAGTLHPAEFAAGDYFDYLPMYDGSIGVVIGDVTGHGFGPALIMSFTHALLRLLVETHTDVAEILALANSVLLAETEEDRFVTLLLARLDPRTRSFVYSNAGHPPGYIFDSMGNVRSRLESTGFPLGIMPNAEFPLATPTMLEPGEMVLLVSDGILESRSPQGAFFGADRALDVVRTNRHRAANQIAESLCQAAREFSRGGDPADDTTAVVIKVHADDSD